MLRSRGCGGKVCPRKALSGPAQLENLGVDT